MVCISKIDYHNLLMSIIIIHELYDSDIIMDLIHEKNRKKKKTLLYNLRASSLPQMGLVGLFVQAH